MIATRAADPKSVAWDALRAELYRFVSRRVAGADADDIVQEALLRIHRGLASVRSDGAIVGWMYQVTRNALADHLRASRPTESLADEQLAEGVENGFVNGLVHGVATELVEPNDTDDSAFLGLARCVEPFVAMLPAHYREAVELVELRGMSHVQAAARLGVPLSTMKSRVQRGRAQLRATLEACCAIDVDVRGHVRDVTPRTVCRCGTAARS